MGHGHVTIDSSNEKNTIREGQNKFNNYFNESFIITSSRYTGIDYSSRAFIFHGQSSSFPKMFKFELENIYEFQEFFAKGDSLSDKHLIPFISSYITNPNKIPKDKIHIVKNLALFTAEVAIATYLKNNHIIPKYLTAHSFGEFAMLVSAGVISYEQMFDIIFYRETLSETPNQLGYMIAINKSKNEIEQLDKEFLGMIHFSNFNSPLQTVISLTPEKCQYAIKFLKNNNIKHVLLDGVPQPYHTQLMLKTSGKFKDKIDELISKKLLTINTPHSTFISSIDGSIYKENQRVLNSSNFSSFISKQLIMPVNFIHQISQLLNFQNHVFIEIGPQSSLRPFIETLKLDNHEIKIEMPQPYYAKLKRGKEKISNIKLTNEEKEIIETINNIISEVTGYDSGSISTQDKFQDDLGIDSIKKAEIIFKVLQRYKIPENVFGSNLNLSKITSVLDSSKFINKIKHSPQSSTSALKIRSPSFSRYEYRWIQETFLSDNHNRPLASEKHTNFCKIQISEITDSSNILNIISFLNNSSILCEKQILLLCDDQHMLFEDIFNLEIANNIITKKIPELLNALKQIHENIDIPQTFERYIVLATTEHSYYAGLDAFFKSLRKEARKFAFRSYRFENALPQISTLKSIVSADLCDEFNYDYFYNKNLERYVSKLKPINTNDHSETGESNHYTSKKQTDNADKYWINSHSVIVGIGGAKGILHNILKNVQKSFASTIYLLGRSHAQDAKILQNLNEFTNKVNVQYIQCDATNFDNFKLIIQDIYVKHKKIDLIINSAGIEVSRLFQSKSAEEILVELNSKLTTTINLLTLSHMFNIKKTFIFSSVVAKFGNPGQTIYSMCNSILTNIVNVYNKSQNETATVIHWQPWDNIGMTNNFAIMQRLKEFNISLLSTETANTMFQKELENDSFNESVFYLDYLDVFKYELPLIAIEKFTPIIGTLVDQVNFKLAKNISLSSDPIIQDHRMGDIKIFPASLSIATFATAYQLLYRSLPLIQSFHSQNILQVSSKESKIILAIDHENEKTCHVSINTFLSHFKAELRYDNNEYDQKTIKTDATLSSCLSDQASTAVHAYELYCKDGIDFGNCFQILHKGVLDNKNNMSIQLINFKSYQKNATNFSHIFFEKLFWISEGVFQSIATKGIIDSTMLSIPTKVKAIRFIGNYINAQEVYCMPIITSIKTSENILYGNVLVVNESKNPIICFEGVEMSFIKKIPQQLINKLVNKFSNR